MKTKDSNVTINAISNWFILYLPPSAWDASSIILKPYSLLNLYIESYRMIGHTYEPVLIFW